MPVKNTRLHARLPPSFMDLDARKTSQLYMALIRKLRGSLMCVAYFRHVILVCLYNLALADIRLTGAGINCLYCSSLL